ncbi:MAG TPA: FAD/NAD(P)-binding protein [Actinomycetota bacterium]
MDAAPADVAIVGGGASGTLLAGHLLRSGAGGPVVVVERAEALGLGVAYSTEDPRHLLNVPAGGMSARCDAPDHFLDWLSSEGEPVEPGAFVPRATYGRYLRASLDEAERGSERPLLRVRGDARSVRVVPEGVEVEVAGAEPVWARRLALAPGNAPPAPLRFVPAGPRHVANPWDPRALDGVGADDPVLLVGTGLTAVDVVLSLASRGHRGPIRAVSRHGLLPQVHRPPADHRLPLRALPAPPRPPSIARLLRWVRTEVRAAEAEGGDWRDVMNAVRPWAQELWLELPPAERRRFLAILSRHWGVHRHRMAPEVGATIEALIEEGRLEVLAARVGEVREGSNGFEVIAEARSGGVVRLPASWIVNCTGPDPDPERSSEPLVVSLLRRGLARRDPLGLGFDCTPEGALVDAWGVASELLLAIGPPRLGSLWETTAVPEIREQAGRLTELLTAQAGTTRTSSPGLRQGTSAMR